MGPRMAFGGNSVFCHGHSALAPSGVCHVEKEYGLGIVGMSKPPVGMVSGHKTSSRNTPLD